MKKLLYILISTLAFSNLAQAALKNPTCVLNVKATLETRGVVNEMQIVGRPEYERIFENLGYTVAEIPKKYEEKDVSANLLVMCDAERDRSSGEIMYLCAAAIGVWQKDASVKSADGFKKLGMGSTDAYKSRVFTEATRAAISASSAFAPNCVIKAN